MPWGTFLARVFEQWVHENVGQVFVQIFDSTLASVVRAPPGVCVFAKTCADAIALEDNGDLYSCDHFVDPRLMADLLAAKRPAAGIVEIIPSAPRNAPCPCENHRNAKLCHAR
ncbi:MAG: hypothetical protein M0004_07400 [Actinomycetota bacterium]|nr:hypothetical protein [Actinomycetota bacterium]